MTGEFCIRAYKAGDRRKVREISYDTAFMGESPEDFFDEEEIPADEVTLYYTDYEPESVFVAEYKLEKKTYASYPC